MTTRQQIREWLQAAPLQTSHMVVATDTWDWTDYHIYVAETENLWKVLASLEKVMEVYSFKIDLEQQLYEHRAYHPE